MLPSWRGVILPAQQAQQDRRLLHIQLEGQLQQAAAAFLALDRSFAGLKRERKGDAVVGASMHTMEPAQRKSH